MRVLIYQCCIAFWLLLLFCEPAAAYHCKKQSISFSAQPRAEFQRLWIDYDVTGDNNAKGMRIHIDFKTYGMKDMDSYVAIYFQNSDGNYLKDVNRNYYSTDGYVALFRSLKPAYTEAVYNDLQLFMPYDELDLSTGKYDLKMDVNLIYKSGGIIQHLTNHDFTYTYSSPSTSTTPTNVSSSGVTATFGKMWVDYDVTENTRLGMRIHVNFDVYNMKNIDGYIAIYFELKNGSKLFTNNLSYRAKNGQVAIYRSLLPPYDHSTYNDVQFFMPYAELNLSPGKYDLRMDVSVIYKNGDLVKDLNKYDFWYEKK